MTASVWDSPDLTGALGDRLADDLRDMVRAMDAAADRSQQTHLGPSEIGNPCSRCLAEKILGIYEPPPFDDPWTRVIGTAIHDWLDAAAVASNVRDDHARWYPEVRVQPDERLLPSGGRCDLFDADTGTVIDHKTTSAERLKKYRLNGPGVTYRRQAHLYGLGYLNAGHKVQNVALAFWPRGGRLRDLWVWTEPFDAGIAEEALTRYDLLRNLCATAGPAIVHTLPSDPDCFVCTRKMSDGTPSSAA